MLLAVERALGPPLDALPAKCVLQRLRIDVWRKKISEGTSKEAGCLVQGVKAISQESEKQNQEQIVFGRTVGQIPSEVAASRSRFPKWSCT